MTLLESGPAKTDRIYWLVVGLLFIGFAGYCVYHGTLGYPNTNRENAAQELTQYTDAAVELPERPTKDDFERLKRANPTSREDVYAVLGQPLPAKGSTGTSDVRYEHFASLYGMATVPIDRSGRVIAQGMQWRKWFKTKGEIQTQFYMAAAVGAFGLYFFYRAYKAATLRAVIDEEGMTYGGVRIAFDDMVSLRDYNPKGWVDLYHRVRGREKRLRIDNQKVARFDEITELVCRKKGFENPIEAYAEAQEREAAAEAEGSQAAETKADEERPSGEAGNDE